MRPILSTNSLHNPFCNRFNDPVKRRHDDMQAHAYMVWLRERNQGLVRIRTSPNNDKISNVPAMYVGRIFAGAVALLVLLLSVAVLWRVV